MNQEIELIRNEVCKSDGISLIDLFSKSRKRKIVMCRQKAMWIAKNHTKASLNDIGAVIGAKDHATVIHACNAINNLRDTDKMFNSEFTDLESMVKRHLERDRVQAEQETMLKHSKEIINSRKCNLLSFQLRHKQATSRIQPIC